MLPGPRRTCTPIESPRGVGVWRNLVAKPLHDGDGFSVAQERRFLIPCTSECTGMTMSKESMFNGICKVSKFPQHTVGRIFNDPSNFVAIQKHDKLSHTLYSRFAVSTLSLSFGLISGTPSGYALLRKGWGPGDPSGIGIPRARLHVPHGGAQ